MQEVERRKSLSEFSRRKSIIHEKCNIIIYDIIQYREQDAFLEVKYTINVRRGGNCVAK